MEDRIDWYFLVFFLCKRKTIQSKLNLKKDYSMEFINGEDERGVRHLFSKIELLSKIAPYFVNQFTQLLFSLDEL
jgi:hypothetical protein